MSKRMSIREARRVKRAMKSALYHGVDPLNSHDVMAGRYESSAKRALERDAEREGHWLDLLYNRQRKPDHPRTIERDSRNGDFVPDYLLRSMRNVWEIEGEGE